MKKILFFAILIASALREPILAQKNMGSIRGQIITADGAAPYITVGLKKLKKFTVTDNNGNFTLLNLPAMQDTLVISSVEAKKFTQPVIIVQNEIVNLGVIYLTFSIGQLQNVEVRGRTLHSYKSDYSFSGTKTQAALIDIPQSISTITKELIKDKMEFTLKDAADDAAGVNNYSGYDDYAIRGFKAENATLINGLRGYNTTYTSAMLVNVERIEVVKGPSATLYGNCDPGGTINLVTKKPLSQKAGELTIAHGTWGHYRAQGDVSGPLNANKTLLYRFNAGYDKTNSFRSQYFAKSYELAPSVSFIPNEKIQLNADFSLSHINTILDRGQPGIQHNYALQSTPVRLIASQPGDYLHETDFAANLLFSYKINRHINFNSGYLHYTTQQNTAEHGVESYITPDSVNLYFTNWRYHTATNTFTNYFTLHFKTGKFNHQLLLGYDNITSEVELGQKYYEDRNFGEGKGIAGTFSLKNPVYFIRPTSKYNLSAYQSEASNVEASIYNTQGIYLQEQISLNKWKLLVGLRQEMYEAGDGDDEGDSTDEDEANVFLPRVGLVYELKPGVSLYATYNKGFDPFEASTSTQLFDEPFKPVTSELYETGLKANIFHNKLAATVSVYQLTLHNVAVNANVISNPNLYIQQGKDRSAGVETEVNGNILSNVSISASYSYCVAKIIKSKIASEEGTLVENSPRNQSNSWLKYSFKNGALKGFGIVAGHSQAGTRNTLEHGFTLPGYLLVNAGLRYEYKHFNASVNVNNLLNKNYWIGAYNNVNKWPGAPLNCMVTAGYTF